MGIYEGKLQTLRFLKFKNIFNTKKNKQAELSKVRLEDDLIPAVIDILGKIDREMMFGFYQKCGYLKSE